LTNFKFLIFPALLTLTLSCSPQYGLKQVDRTSQERTLLGLFTIKLPQGDNWYDLNSAKNSISFRKTIESKGNTFTVSTNVKKVSKTFNSKQQFLSTVKSARIHSDVPANYNLLKHDEKIDSSLADYCTKFRLKTTQKGQQRHKKYERKIIEKHGFTCLHPKRRDLMITIQYTTESQLFYISRENLLEGENFIRSLTFR